MKTRVHFTIIGLLAFVLSTVLASAVQAQYPSQPSTNPQKKTTPSKHGSMNMSEMMREPHHVLAVAYKDNLTTFTKALNAQAKQGGPINTEFAKAAVAEIRRSFDQMNLHLQDHMTAMGSKVSMSMHGMEGQMETHLAPMREHLGELETEIQSATPDPKKVAEHTSEMLKHLNAVSAMHRQGKGTVRH